MTEKYSITKKEEVYNLLKNKRNFEYMSETLLRKLIDVMKVIRFREERILIKEGSENALCYIIIKGSVSVYVGGKFLYTLRRTGDVFGEISFVTKSISTATIKADKDLGVMAISYNIFNKLQNVELALWIARVIGEKLIRTSKLKSEPSPEVETPVDIEKIPDIPDIMDEKSKEEPKAKVEITDLENESENSTQEMETPSEDMPDELEEPTNESSNEGLIDFELDIS